MYNTPHDELMGSILSYLASLLAFMSDLPWASIGASVLLVARLIQDVPAAIAVLKAWRQKRNDQSNR